MNPLLQNTRLPLFSQIRPEHMEPALDHILAENRARMKELLQQKSFTWNSLMQPLDALNDHFNQLWLTISHLHGVMDSEALRAAYNACLTKVTEYSIEMSHNKELYQAMKSLADSAQFQQLDPIQQHIIKEELRDFHLAGVDLEPKAQQRFSEIQQRLSKLTNDFEENLLDATQAWSCHIQDPGKLSGIPEYALAEAAHAAQQKKLSGWLFTLEIPSYIAVLTYADVRELREEIYYAYCTRASDQGPHAGRWDNSSVMQEIVQLRLEMAQLLGFDNFAELSLSTKTAKSTGIVLKFINELAHYCLPKAQREFLELSQFGASFSIDPVQPWDISYLTEKLRQRKFALAEEELRDYFPADQVLRGMFDVVHRLFGITIQEDFGQEDSGFERWHSDVRFFTLYDASQKIRAQFYLDLYARKNKRGGAWAEECRSHRRLADGSLQIPVAFLTCNFARPVGDKPALLLHEDVLTLFHEFGHGLHQMLSKVDYASVSGTNGVPWDVVEFPSQFMENWCWEKAALDLISRHFQTGERLPDALYQKLFLSKTFQAGLKMLRQLEFALFDFRIHIECNPRTENPIQQIIDQIRKQWTPFSIPKYNRFQHGFSHIFGGGYAAGYYSYKWSEVWSSDAFALFEENGIFDQATGKSFLENILEKGGSEDPLILFNAFRGRQPEIDALLRHLGEKE